MIEISVGKQVLEACGINITLGKHSFPKIVKQLKQSLKPVGLDKLVKSEASRSGITVNTRIYDVKKFIKCFFSPDYRYYPPGACYPCKIGNYVDTLCQKDPELADLINSSDKTSNANKYYEGKLGKLAYTSNVSTRTCHPLLIHYHTTHKARLISVTDEQQILQPPKNEKRQNWRFQYDDTIFKGTARLWDAIFKDSDFDDFEKTSKENFNKRINARFKYYVDTDPLSLDAAAIRDFIQVGEYKHNSFTLYKIFDSEADWVYVGITCDFKRRQTKHLNYAMKHDNERAIAFRKARANNTYRIEPLKTSLSAEDACEAEVAMIAEYRKDTSKTVYNASLGGEMRPISQKITRHNYETFETDIIKLTYRQFGAKYNMVPEVALRDLEQFSPGIEERYKEHIQKRVDAKNEQLVKDRATRVMDKYDGEEGIEVDRSTLTLVIASDNRQKFTFEYSCATCKSAGRVLTHEHKYEKDKKNTATKTLCTGCNKAVAPNTTNEEAYRAIFKTHHFEVNDLKYGETRSLKAKSEVTCDCCGTNDNVSVDKMKQRLLNNNKGSLNPACKHCNKSVLLTATFNDVCEKARAIGLTIVSTVDDYKNTKSPLVVQGEAKRLNGDSIKKRFAIQQRKIAKESF
jgi:predicted GIY-YIG superfamily endonuclease